MSGLQRAGLDPIVPNRPAMLHAGSRVVCQHLRCRKLWQFSWSTSRKYLWNHGFPGGPCNNVKIIIFRWQSAQNRYVNSVYMMCNVLILHDTDKTLRRRNGYHMTELNEKPLEDAEDIAEHGAIEEIFETILFQSRFMVLLAVLGSLVAAFCLFIKGCIEVIQTVNALIPDIRNFHPTPADDKGILLAVVPAIDYFLFAIVLLMFSMGLYELFISKIDPKCRIDAKTRRLKPRPAWLHFPTIDSLKSQIGKVIMMILIVNFFEHSFSVNYNAPSDLLYLAGSLLLVAVALYTTHIIIPRSNIAPNRAKS